VCLVSVCFAGAARPQSRDVSGLRILKILIVLKKSRFPGRLGAAIGRLGAAIGRLGAAIGRLGAGGRIENYPKVALSARPR
jgi:hypothetical protein